MGVYELSGAGSLKTPRTVYSSMNAGNQYGAMVPIASQTIASTSTPFNFTNIPQTYQDLRLVVSARGSYASTTFGMYGYFNNGSGTTQYSTTFLLGDGVAQSVRRTSASDFSFGEMISANGTAGVFASVTIDILNYANTSTFKTMLARTASDANGSGATYLTANLWSNTSAISTMTFGMASYVSMVAGSTATLYGIRAVSS